MRQNIFHLSIQKKTHYFSYLFHRKMLDQYSFNPMTTLYFEDKTGEGHSHHTLINNKNVFEHTHSKDVYENTYPQYVYNTNVYTNNHSLSLEYKEKNDFAKGDSMARSNYLFHNKIANRFRNFSFNNNDVSSLAGKEKNDFAKGDSTARNTYLFHHKIANRFRNFSFAKQNELNHTEHVITFANTRKNFSSSNDTSFHHQVKYETHKYQNINPTELIHQKEKTYIETKHIEQLEQRVLTQVEQKLKENLLVTKSTQNTQEEHIRIQREEKKDADKIYTLVMQRWDKEQKRKGHLYA